MNHGSRLVALLAAVALACPALGAQEFQPPGSAREAGSGGLRLDLIAFSTRGGVDLSDGASLVLGSSFDVAELWSPAVRLRPSFEFSGSGATRALHLGLEVVYRFQPDSARAIPYVGLGLGYYHEGGGGESKLWPTVAMGLELSFRPAFNWLVEYHSLDRLGRHRLLVGLSTRGARSS